ncbi:MAG: mannosyltransferase family protein [Patescibacteria group bacterium]
MRKVLVSIIILFVSLQTLNVISRYIIFDRTSYEPILNTRVLFPQIVNPWLNFDGQNYLNIVKLGYNSEDLLVFFPLYPMIIRVLSFGGFINQIYLGLFLSFLFSSCALLALYELVKKYEGESVAFKTVLVFLLFPTSFFLFSFYTEGVFLLLTVFFFWTLRNKLFWASSLLVMLALVTKIFGLALLAPLIYSMYNSASKKVSDIISLFFIPFGLLAYFYFVYIEFGNPLLVFTGQGLPKYGRSIGIYSPITILQETFFKIVRGPTGYDNVFVYPVIVLEAITIIFAAAMLILTYKKLRIDYWLFCFAVIIIIIFSGGLSSDLRYILILFPFYIYIAKHFSRPSLVIWSIISMTLLIFASTLFLRNYWTG